MVTRRADDPSTDDFTAQRRSPIEVFWQHKFDSLFVVLAQVARTATDTKTELHEQLEIIIKQLAQLSQLSDKVDRLQQEIDAERKEHEKFEANEARLESLINDLGEKINHLEIVTQVSWREQLMFDVSPIALIILIALAFYYVFFS